MGVDQARIAAALRNPINLAFDGRSQRAVLLDQADRPTLGVPNVGRNGRWQLNLFDPDGTRIELMEPFRIR